MYSYWNPFHFNLNVLMINHSNSNWFKDQLFHYVITEHSSDQNMQTIHFKTLRDFLRYIHFFQNSKFFTKHTILIFVTFRKKKIVQKSTPR